MKTNKLKAAIYCRVSTEEQTSGFSLDAQQSVLEVYAEAKGYQIYDFYVDDGYSGKDFERPAVQRLFRDMRSRKFDAIIVWKVDRFSRSNKDVLTVIDDELKPRKMKLLVSTCDIDSSTPNGYMFISLLGTFAEYERTMIVERVDLGMQKRAVDGFWCGGKVLGYDNDTVNKTLLINEQESKIVKEIFSLRSQGLGYKSITNLLNEQGKRTKNGKLFSIPGIKLILENEVYIGNVVWGKHRQWNINRRKGKNDNPIKVKGKHDPIIDMELWDKVQAVNQVQKENAPKHSNFKGDFILTGILRCPACGSGTVMSKSKKNGKYHLYYMCQSHHSKGRASCGSNLIRKGLIEEKVLQVIQGIIQDKNLVDEIIEKLERDKTNDTSGQTENLKMQRIELRKQQEQKAQADQWLDEGRITPEAYSERINRANRKIEELELIIANIEREIDKATSAFNIDKDMVIEALTNFDTLFECATNEEKRILMKSLIKEIVMEPNRKEIKTIVFWFSEGNGLPVKTLRRTVS
ncbi:recombinase family protein [Brevibacillus sp. FSL L8-0710]|uniref:recombinase family protein n=1 Tax=Brevibacillus sp. FSL L8-0710 TaxID=2975313 RepID=UPI0030F8ADD9